MAGLLVYGMAGTGVTLLLAPQSRKKTLAQIQKKSNELRDQKTAKGVKSTVAQVRGKARKITDAVHEQSADLQKRGGNMLDEQRGHLSRTLKGWGKAVQA